MGVAKNEKCSEWTAQAESLQQEIIAACERCAVWDLPETEHLRKARVAIDDLLLGHRSRAPDSRHHSLGDHYVRHKPQGGCCTCGDSKRKLYLIGLFGCVICSA